MPTYEYKCSNCGHIMEEFQSIKADPLLTCPNCGKETLRRSMGGGGGLIFKGQGFYLTDYKKSGSRSSNGSKTDKADAANKTKPSEPPKTDSSKKGDTPPPASKPPDKNK